MVYLVHGESRFTPKSLVLFSSWNKPSIDWSRYDQVIEKLEVTEQEMEATVEFSGLVADMVTNLWSFRDAPQSRTQSPQAQSRRMEMIEFVQRLLIFTDAPSTVVFVGLNYLYRLRTSGIFTEDPACGSEYRVLVVALLVASKYIEDQSYSNQSWSEVSGFDAEEVNLMEREFLTELDWNLWISPEEYEGWIEGIDHWLAKEEWENEGTESEADSELDSEYEWPLTPHSLDAECQKFTQLSLAQELKLSNDGMY
ncbi:hypothetical protein K493DRAFT_321007 [Basidiobolus meristosporus CBS 931.73]|uniref:Cyclin N-terminal domain-containing protein n=1 Tax=Basidiobolus meristosporus CBS 931.73 TaxID=1314790 RepID=A0A1Y1X1Q6_9FUNG|nr:hypothetical protein K493DRAFT_321007 [Basidiobolus meristosporus CBS 931.73]|eukprot:ORX79703.1 hypothetical protein K493DRAFT_321007 [Basidiobolus meristosporus CBS 931.73]